MFGVMWTGARRQAGLKDGAQCRAALRQVRWEPIHFTKAGVADDQTLVALEHAQAVRHVLERRVEQHVRLLQRPLGSLERGSSGCELALAPHPDGDGEKYD